ncbi:MAG TPA: tRNA (adenosine(37)-N6)-threonylcarbamoyltransferase complex transferase subunit TsaD [Novosphingobium sp.]|nr:tRNA (adenosine(37)-N6)-threonylcarbamoyltransferase complex transferase subunit TsaD [Novosphingobium sp.]
MALILGIESSCDETAAAVIDSNGTTLAARIVAQRIASQDDAHRPYGGVVPEIAARAHVEVLGPMVGAVLADAGLTLDDMDAIAATAGPGLIGGVMVGLVTAKALAMAADKPLVAVNHLEGHALSPRLADPALHYPYLLLLVSGGHCQILEVAGVGQYRRLATTIDDALGEAFDKTAKILGLGYPGGPAVERLAREGDPKAVPLPRPLVGSGEVHFSFAGLKSAVMRAKEARVVGDILRQAQDERGLAQDERGLAQDERMSGGHLDQEPARPEPVEGRQRYADADIAASFQQAALDCVVDRTRIALGAATPGMTALVVAGGVAANAALRGALEALAAQHGLPLIAPPPKLCTDNAAMIGWAGAERFALGYVDALDVAARPRWPLDANAAPVRGAGVKG